MTQPISARRRWFFREPRAGRSWIGQRRDEYEHGIGRTRRRRRPRTLRVLHGVPLTYSPTRSGDPGPGDVVWTWVPFREDARRGKDRPVLVVGRTGEVLAGVPVTSKDKGRDDHVPIGCGAWDRRRRPSWAKVDRLITFHVDDIRTTGGAVSPALFDDVVEGLRAYHVMRDIPPPPTPVAA